MNKFQILNELQRCKETNKYFDDIWFRGVFLGYIHKDRKNYCSHSGNTKKCFSNYSAAIGYFVEKACEIVLSQQEKHFSEEPKIVRIGQPKKSLWQMIKELF